MMLPTDQSHVVAFLVALSGMAALGLGAYVYIWRATPKRKSLAEQRSFDFAPEPQKAAAKKYPAPPMAHV